MSLNSNSTHLLCNELSQTQQKNELTHELVCFFRLPISQIVNQSKRLLRLPKILQTGWLANNHCSVYHKTISYSANHCLVIQPSSLKKSETYSVFNQCLFSMIFMFAFSNSNYSNLAYLKVCCFLADRTEVMVKLMVWFSSVVCSSVVVRKSSVLCSECIVAER